MSPRQRRLHADFEKLKAEFSKHPNITLEYEAVDGNVPERYFVAYKDVRGIKLSSGSTKDEKVPEYINEHKIEIYLHIDYPRLKPQCYILTEIFHPNFRIASPHDICIGDYWASGETLVDIIYQIGEMIQYKNYGISSPLNGIAAKWARENKHLFPSDDKELRLGEIDIDLHDVEIELNDSK
ncbi:MAG: hypothetical protein KDC42_06195 [Ignavibacteriae bacterium]|nr:hypothetical protein [Ignavibacteriota bacterium]